MNWQLWGWIVNVCLIVVINGMVAVVSVIVAYIIHNFTKKQDKKIAEAIESMDTKIEGAITDMNLKLDKIDEGVNKKIDNIGSDVHEKMENIEKRMQDPSTYRAVGIAAADRITDNISDRIPKLSEIRDSVTNSFKATIRHLRNDVAEAKESLTVSGKEGEGGMGLMEFVLGAFVSKDRKKFIAKNILKVKKKPKKVKAKAVTEVNPEIRTEHEEGKEYTEAEIKELLYVEFLKEKEAQESKEKRIPPAPPVEESDIGAPDPPTDAETPIAE